MNLDLPEADVLAQCEKSGVRVSAIEPLLSGGTHLVCLTSDGADEIRLKLRSRIIAGAVRRAAFFRPKASR